MKFVNLCTVANSFEADFLKEDLEENGIGCILTNVNFTNLMPHLNGMLGSGIQVLVDKEDLTMARTILESRKKRPPTQCPNCHSTRIKFGLGTKNRLKRILAIVISIIGISPFSHIVHRYYCADCETEFSK